MKVDVLKNERQGAWIEMQVDGSLLELSCILC
jgi:hypothetical protein